MKNLYFVIIFFISIITISYSYAITPEQIIKLKKAGVSDKTIQMMLKQEKKAAHIVKDQQGNVYIIYSTGESEQKSKPDIEEEEKTKKAWKMLEDTIIDIRP
ncbi:MAG: hypothetical protein GWP10_16460 [Nitrospiraceae bacterium]|nr:hypothetical protein [Nitrospiraceae bacterium]